MAHLGNRHEAFHEKPDWLEVEIHGVSLIRHARGANTDLLWHRRLQKLVLSSRGLIGSKETHDKPVLYLWNKASGLGKGLTQMTIRLHDDEKDRWLTSSRKFCLPEQAQPSSSQPPKLELTTPASFPRLVIHDSEDTRRTQIGKGIKLNGLTFQRGPVIDHQHMKAVHYRGGNAVELRRGARELAITFEDNDGGSCFYPCGFLMTPSFP